MPSLLAKACLFLLPAISISIPCQAEYPVCVPQGKNGTYYCFEPSAVGQRGRQRLARLHIQGLPEDGGVTEMVLAAACPRGGTVVETREGWKYGRHPLTAATRRELARRLCALPGAGKWHRLPPGWRQALVERWAMTCDDIGSLYRELPSDEQGILRKPFYWRGLQVERLGSADSCADSFSWLVFAEKTAKVEKTMAALRRRQDILPECFQKVMEDDNGGLTGKRGKLLCDCPNHAGGMDEEAEEGPSEDEKGAD